MQCCFLSRASPSRVCYRHYIMQASSNLSAPPAARQASLEDRVFGNTRNLVALNGERKKILSDPSIILTEQLLTLVNLNRVFLYSCQTASGKHWMKWESFYWSVNNWGTLLPWSHLPWAVCHNNTTLLMQGSVLMKLASDVPQLNLSGIGCPSMRLASCLVLCQPCVLIFL